ncbi:[NiFe]-hydrogenase assembly chaperone HybE [Caenispirillum salinarum]|uniref:[NiFe]-hydrogenase assembly chaperone HybE n=1 Tax=Caenispirillum salinarum TaxID=859058 RepID=UPI00384EBB8D
MTEPTPELTAARATALEDAFAAIDRGSMADMPLRNDALAVEAISFRPWGLERGPALLGILVTPWCMNVMLVPPTADDPAWATLSGGEKESHGLPCGVVEFTAGAVDGFGPYLMCSLFSPVKEFADQPAARLTAQLALEDLLTPPAEEIPPPAPTARRRGDGPAPSSAGGADGLSRRSALGMARAPRGRDGGR